MTNLVASLQISEHYDWRQSDDTIRVRGHDSGRPASCFTAKVDVFEDRVRGWFLDVARELLGSAPSPGDYVAVSILLAYVEGIEQFRQGQNTPDKKAREWFSTSLKRILGTGDEELVKQMWKRGRNGLFHDSFTKEQTVLSRDSIEAATVNDEVLRINPVALARTVYSDFETYIAQLRKDPDGDLSARFQVLWDARWESS
jgi:hypothetical protein